VYVHTIAGSQECEYEDCHLLGCDDEQPGKGRNLRRELLPPFSEYIVETEVGEAG